MVYFSDRVNLGVVFRGCLKDIQGQMYALKRQLNNDGSSQTKADTYIVLDKTNNETEIE